MFSKSAEIYDLIYGFKDYKSESEKIIDLITKQKPDCRTILDVGCGTAEHHKFLKEKYVMKGVDLNTDLIAVSNDKNKDCKYYVADMRTMDIGKTFDAVLCLFSSIGYLRSQNELEQAFTRFAKHLNPGGVVIVEPWFTPDKWTPGNRHVLNAENEQMKVCRMNHSVLEGDVSVLNFHYMINSEKGVDYFSERHELKMFTTKAIIGAFEKAGFKVQFDQDGLIGRGIYIARRK